LEGLFVLEVDAEATGAERPNATNPDLTLEPTRAIIFVPLEINEKGGETCVADSDQGRRVLRGRFETLQEEGPDRSGIVRSSPSPFLREAQRDQEEEESDEITQEPQANS
jgi:hypothetical protein